MSIIVNDTYNSNFGSTSRDISLEFRASVSQALLRTNRVSGEAREDELELLLGPTGDGAVDER